MVECTPIKVLQSQLISLAHDLPLIIGLPYDRSITHIPLVAGKLPKKTLVANLASTTLSASSSKFAITTEKERIKACCEIQSPQQMAVSSPNCAPPSELS